MHPHVHLVVKAEHEYGGPRLNPRKADLQRWRERFAEYMTELGVLRPRRGERIEGCEDGKEDPDLSGRSKDAKAPAERGREPRPSNAGGRFGLYAQEARGRQAGAAGREWRRWEQYRSLLNVRAQVNERYREAIQWLRSRGREEEARRFELMQRNLAPVKTENQLIADTLVAHNEGRTRDGQHPRAAS